MTTAPRMPDCTASRWWSDSTIYQLYLPSFRDSNGDGFGDLRGAASGLDYLADLGLDAVWLSPFYPSPMADWGYDISDHRAVHPAFGSLADFDAFVKAATERGLKVVVDVVPNHTSSEHPWFQEALRSEPGSDARARYIFREGKGHNGEVPPNNWTSNFGGPAWTRVPDGQWYLHTFHTTQPELNWERRDVREDFAETLRFWFDRGVYGVRIDVAHGLAKPAGLPDLTTPLAALVASDQPDPRRDADGIHEIHREIRAIVDSYPDRMSIGEAWVRDRDRQRLYLLGDELHGVFDFKLIVAPWHADAIRTAIDEALDVVRGTAGVPSWVLSNHDQVRHVTRYGDGLVGTRRARAATLLQLALPGARYVYMGDELGLPRVEPPPEARLDPSQKGRDNCRIPIPWSGDEPPYGFSSAARTWLPAPAGWAPLCADRQRQDKDSMWHLYRTAIAERRIFAEDLAWRESPPGVLVFARGAAQCHINFRNTAVPLPPGRVQLSSVPLRADGTLPGDAAAWVLPDS
jgi:alpha-glucosidase